MYQIGWFSSNTFFGRLSEFESWGSTDLKINLDLYTLRKKKKKKVDISDHNTNNDLMSIITHVMMSKLTWCCCVVWLIHDVTKHYKIWNFKSLALPSLKTVVSKSHIISRTQILFIYCFMNKIVQVGDHHCTCKSKWNELDGTCCIQLEIKSFLYIIIQGKRFE